MSYLNQFSYQISGPENGRKWVFLHGLMGYGANWRKIVSGLEGSERVLTFDQRGHGRSMKPVSGYAPEDFADDLMIITEELGWDKFVLVGHSMGGRNALNFANRFAHKLEKLVIEDIGPDGDAGAVAKYQQLFKLIPTPFKIKKDAKDFFYNTFPVLAAKAGRAQANLLGQYLYSNLEDKEDGTVDWRFSKEAMLAAVREGRAKDRWYELEALSIPTLVIRGQNSVDLSPEVFREMLKRNALIQGVEIVDSGHWVHTDQPAIFLAELKKFVGVNT